MTPSNRAEDNRRAVSAAADVLSPELVLVSSPEEAARARQLLWETIIPAAAPKPVLRIAPSAASGTSRRGAALFDAVCVAGTLGPLLLAVFAR
jgi:hypothetical protein